ncbi:MAG: ubiquinone biosynthesis protein UbiJ [Gammaproteobacteria bacterium]
MANFSVPDEQKTKISALTKNMIERMNDLLNRTIQDDEKTHYLLRELGRCSIAFKLRGTGSALTASIDNGSVVMSRGTESTADVSIEGSISDFIAMARTQRDGTSLAAGKVSIQGDLATAQNVQTLIAGASFDWEELIARRTGDVVARRLTRGVQSGLSWLQHAHSAVERDMDEYLHYELRLLPTAREIEEFIQRGAVIAADVDRLKARIDRLHRLRKSN